MPSDEADTRSGFLVMAIIAATGIIGLGPLVEGLGATQTIRPFAFEYEIEILKKRLLEYTSPRITRALILLDAYLHPEQKNLIAENFHIEHIFPQKWQNTNYNGWEEKDAQKYLEWYGNKVVFESK